MKSIFYNLEGLYPWDFLAEKDQGEGSSHKPSGGILAIETLPAEIRDTFPVKIAWPDTFIDWAHLDDAVWIDDSEPNAAELAPSEEDTLERAGCSHAEPHGDPDALEPQNFSIDLQERNIPQNAPIIFPDNPLYPKEDFAGHQHKKPLHVSDAETSSDDDVDYVGTSFDADFINLIDIR